MTYVCPKYSTVKRSSARQPVRLTDPTGPGAGWHLHEKDVDGKADAMAVVRHTSNRQTCPCKHPLSEE